MISSVISIVLNLRETMIKDKGKTNKKNPHNYNIRNVLIELYARCYGVWATGWKSEHVNLRCQMEILSKSLNVKIWSSPVAKETDL